MWVADMDFAVPDAVRRALEERVRHPIYGYGTPPRALVEAILEHLERLYQWKVDAEALTFFPGVVAGFSVAVRALANAGGRLLIQTPVYPPILKAASRAGLGSAVNQLIAGPGGYQVDFDQFDAAAGHDTCAFLLCSPHNPVGRVFRPDELSRMAEICLRRRIPIIADEIHCDLVYSGHRHTPVATLSPELARRCITLMAPSKTFNIAGLECAFAVIPDPELRQRFEEGRAGMVPEVNVLASAAALAAYQDGQPWLRELLGYLEANRDRLVDFVRERMPALRVSSPEGTFLAWVDCRHAGLPCEPGRFFLARGRVAFNEGRDFGLGGEGFVRLNFGCPRSILEEGLNRMAAALGSVAG